MVVGEVVGEVEGGKVLLCGGFEELVVVISSLLKLYY